MKGTKRTTGGGYYLEDLNKVGLTIAEIHSFHVARRWAVIMRARMHGKLTMSSLLEEVRRTKGSNQQRRLNGTNRDIWMCPCSKIE